MKGQSLVEFGIYAALIVTLFYIIIEGGYVLRRQLILASLTRETARFAARREIGLLWDEDPAEARRPIEEYFFDHGGDQFPWWPVLGSIDIQRSRTNETITVVASYKSRSLFNPAVRIPIRSKAVFRSKPGPTPTPTAWPE